MVSSRPPDQTDENYTLASIYQAIVIGNGKRRTRTLQALVPFFHKTRQHESLMQLSEWIIIGSKSRLFGVQQ